MPGHLEREGRLKGAQSPKTLLIRKLSAMIDKQDSMHGNYIHTKSLRKSVHRRSKRGERGLTKGPMRGNYIHTESLRKSAALEIQGREDKKIVVTPGSNDGVQIIIKM